MTTMRYNLQQMNEFSFSGFTFEIPKETIDIINSLTGQIGSQTFITESLFQKKEEKKDDINAFTSSSMGSTCRMGNKKRKGNKGMEVMGEEWENLRTFQATKIEQKTGLDGLIDQIRLNLNKLTDKTFLDIREKIISNIETILGSEELNDTTMEKVSSAIYDIASANKFYSKIYADLYAELADTYKWLRPVFDVSLTTYMDQFKNILYVDPDKDYDKFCDMNKTNECRKANSQFFVNLALNGFISKSLIVKYLYNLLVMVVDMINESDKKNEVDEITENVAILFNKELMQEIDAEKQEINGKSIVDTIKMLANSKAKDYKSLSNKAIFKYMDLIEM
jgi:hypothetical protein